MLAKYQMVDRNDECRLKGFWICDRTGKAVAIGAEGAFLRILAKRYANDTDLVRAAERLASLTASLPSAEAAPLTKSRTFSAPNASRR
jgi:hypothetical protein